jgi:hypothetical protein
MKTLGFLIAMAFTILPLSAQNVTDGSTVTGKDDVDSVIKKTSEVSLNVFGLFLGSYAAQFEESLGEDGLFGLGVKATYTNQSLGTLSTSGIEALLEARIYPARYRRGLYFLAEGGYSNFTVNNGTSQAGLSSLPWLAGLGWKWVINEFSIDTGLAYGRQFYLNAPTNGVFDINSFPFNIAYDVYVLAGYRF